MPAYLVTEVDTKHKVDEGGTHVTSKDIILKQCKVRADDWTDVVMVRVTCAPVTCMHQTHDVTKIVCSSANVPGDSKECNKDTDETPQSEMRADRTKIWDSVGLHECFKELIGRCMIC